MAVNEASLLITDSYRDQAAQGSEQGGLEIEQGFEELVSWTDIDGGFDRFAIFAAATVGSYQARQAILADSYVASYLSSELGERIAPQGISTAPYSLTDEFGRSIRRALEPPVYTFKLAILKNVAVPIAQKLGSARARRIATTMIAHAGRAAMTDLMTESPYIDGWVRVARGTACGACLALADGRVHETDEPFRGHPNCRCVQEPVLVGDRGSVSRPTGQQIFNSKSKAEQDALFEGRGGAAKADLIRGGMPLTELVDELPMKLGGVPMVSEKPLSALS